MPELDHALGAPVVLGIEASLLTGQDQCQQRQQAQKDMESVKPGQRKEYRSEGGLGRKETEAFASLQAHPNQE